MITFMVGLPGSGKTTWLAKNKGVNDFIVCRDVLRTMVYGKYDFKIDDEPMILDMAINCVKAIDDDGLNVFVDETSLSLAVRNKWRDRLSKNSFIPISGIIQYLVFPTLTLDEYIERRMKEPRGYHYEHWKGVISKMINNYQPFPFDESEKVYSVKYLTREDVGL